MVSGEREKFMVVIAFIFLLVIGVAVHLSIAPKNTVAQRQKASEQKKAQEIADWIVNNLSVVKDPRKDLCIGYVVQGTGYDIKHMFYVPCESVPPNLLTLGVIKEK